MNAKRPVAPRFRVLLTFFAIFTAALLGQAIDSTLVGTVTDGTGAAVPNANISATNKDTGVKHTSVTNSSRHYRLNNVPLGRYDGSATADGFSKATRATRH